MHRQRLVSIVYLCAKLYAMVLKLIFWGLMFTGFVAVLLKGTGKADKESA